METEPKAKKKEQTAPLDSCPRYMPEETLGAL